MPKMVFGLDRFYKHTKSNRSNMLAWNELHDVKGQLGPFTDLQEGDAVINGEGFAFMPAGGWDRVKAADLIH